MKKFFLYVLLAIPTALNAQWGPDTKLSTNEVSASLNENMAQCVVANGSTVHVVWSDSGIDSGAIFYKRSLDGGATWGADTQLSATSGHDDYPYLAVSGSYVHVTFLENSGTAQATSCYKRSTDGGTTWGPNVALATTKWWPGVAAAGNMVYVSLETLVTPTNSEVYFMRSTDNGTTWGAQQQISNANGRSEDPSISAHGNYVDLAWNDNRDTYPTGMSVYTRRSSDMGVTWGAETALTRSPAFTYFPSIFLSGPNVDVPYGDKKTGANYSIYFLHSGDLGTTWATPQQITNAPTIEELYPAIVRDGSNIHLVWYTSAGITYQHSGNGGTTWDPAVLLTSQGASPFIAVSGTKVYVVFVSQRDGHGAIYYKINPTGNPASSPGITSANNTSFTVGQSGSFILATTGSPAPAFSISGLPSWASIDPQTGVLSGTPTNSGAFTGTITASNGVGSDATQTFTLNVNASLDPSPFNGLSLGGNWFYNVNFGIYNTTFYPWINHNNLGFVYLYTGNNTDLYLYAVNGNPAPMGWLYTTPTILPYYYSFTKGAWLWYGGGTSFYNFNTQAWETY